ncbi:hypothetical protein LE181_05145 [Streptomyces sp. SCA3-4]|uniref:hypothetical protein n=1 Tax=Streptomyces sichuanensis TaxID=2871810 RepID=UPI001CE27C6D|nr:hypothetical protein [Streptomyces sichuanensis]MCA6091553.1 hypothetical protein [Streptomyces sichuanensis]
MGRRQTVGARARVREAYGRHHPKARPSAGGAPGGVRAWDRNWRREARTAWWCGLSLGGVLLLADLARGGLDWERGCSWTAIGAALVAVLRPPRITAGEDWLAARGLLREHRVRTDLLTQVRRADGVAPRLVLRDVGGNRVELDPAVLAANPLLWHRLDAGARRSRERGLLREGAVPLAALAARIDGEGARRLLKSAGLE